MKRRKVILYICETLIIGGLCGCGKGQVDVINSSSEHMLEGQNIENIGTMGDETVENIFANSSEDDAANLDIDGITFSINKMHSAQNEWYGRLVKEVNEYTGMDVVWQWHNNASYYQELEKQLVTGNVADIVYVQKTESFIQAAEDGLFWDIGPYLDEYENLAMISKVLREDGSYNGKMYAIPNRRCSSLGLIYRLDWLNNLGLSEPTDWASFCEMLEAFTYSDPDKNGVDDTVGLYLNNDVELWNVMECWFGVPNVWGIDENGDLIHKSRTSEYQEAYDAFRDLYARGVINNGNNNVMEFYSVDEASTVYEGGFSAGLGGSTIGSMSEASSVHIRLVKTGEIGEEKIYALQGVVDTGNGVKLYPEKSTIYVPMIAISTRRVKTEDQLRKVLNFLNVLHEPKCVELLTYGWEGENYSLNEKGEHVVINCNNIFEIRNALSGFNGVLLCAVSDVNNPVVPTYSKGSLSEWMSISVSNAEDFVPNYGGQFLTLIEQVDVTALENMLDAIERKYVTGEIDKEAFSMALEEWWENGGEIMNRELNERYHAAKGRDFNEK